MDNRGIRIWVIWVCETCQVDEDGFTNYGGCRTWGYYTNKETAIQALHENWADMWEYRHDYAVIEAFDEGISHCVLGSVQWFKFSKETHGYLEIPMPDSEFHNCCYGMG